MFLHSSAFAASGVPVLFQSSSGRSAPFASATESSSSPFAAGAFMFGAAQETPQYRTVIVPSQRPSAAASSWNPLAQSAEVARAVDVAAYQSREHHQWYQSPAQAQDGFHGYGVASKQHQQQHLAAGAPHALKELALPRLETLLVTLPPSFDAFTLPQLPLYIEATCFSCPASAAQRVWAEVQQQMHQAEVVMAREADFQLTCSASIGVACSEFNIRCYAGHYKEVGHAKPASPSGTFFTVEFQRRSGCCVAAMQLFRHVLRSLMTHMQQLQLDSEISPEVDLAPGGGANASGQADCDMSDVDLSALPMPCLSPTSAGHCMRVCPIADPTLYDSLMDLLASDSAASQLAALNSLALCLDGTNPRAGDLMAEVASKIRQEGACSRVKQAAAKLLATAAATPTAAAMVIRNCLPTVLAQLTAGCPTTDGEGASSSTSLQHSFAAETQKSLLRSCMSLATAVPAALDADHGGVMAGSRLKRGLLRMATAAENDEVRRLARATMNAITV